MKSVCIGINKFTNSPQNNLNGCVNDAMDMAEVFHSITGGDSLVLCDVDATKYSIIKSLRVLRDQVKEDKLKWVGFSFSSHGTTYPCPDEPDGLGEALVCANVRVGGDGEWDKDTIITDKELHTLLWTFPSDCIVEAWFDTCFSGGMDRGPDAGRTDKFLIAPSARIMEPLFPSTRITVGLPPWVVMWCASSEQQTSADAYIKSNWHGAFTYFWKQAWEINPTDRRVGLLLESRQGLKKGHYEQLPRLKSYNKPAQSRVGS